jgi:hypothetical protein
MQEFIALYTPEQNGMVERCSGDLNEACVWQHRFVSFEHARREPSARIRWYDEQRSFGSHWEFRAREVTQVA